MQYITTTLYLSQNIKNIITESLFILRLKALM